MGDMKYSLGDLLIDGDKVGLSENTIVTINTKPYLMDDGKLHFRGTFKFKIEYKNKREKRKAKRLNKRINRLYGRTPFGLFTGAMNASH